MSDGKQHAKRAPSSAHRWGGEHGCRGSVVLMSDYKDSSSIYAKRGTCAHAGADIILRGAVAGDKWQPVSAETLIGCRFVVEGTEEMVFDKEMAGWVDEYIDRVAGYWKPGRILYPERRVGVGHVTGEKGGKGTSDCVIVDIEEMLLISIDFKTGSGVRVDAPGNEQLILYADGSIYELELVWGKFQTVTLAIIQPPIHHYDEWTVDYPTFATHVERLRAAGLEVDDAEAAAADRDPMADTIWQEAFLKPSEDNCRFCRPDCPARRRAVEWITTEVALSSDFRQLGDNSLSTAMDKVGMVEDWCKDIRAEVERRLFLGERVTGWKLVQGKQGNRAWSSKAEVAQTLVAAGAPPEAIYTEPEVLSVAQMEKATKKKFPQAWEAAQKHIYRPEGKPSVAPASDARPAMAINAVASDFRDRTQEEVKP